MRRLILFRHAKSDWSLTATADHDRGLATRGRKAAGPMGAWLAGRGFRPDLVLCSTAKRAKATWDIAKGAFTPAPETRVLREAYEASAEGLLDLIRSAPSEAQTLMLVGHNPGLADLVDLLAGSGDPEARRLLSVKFPTAAIAVLDLPFDRWTETAPRAGRLDRFVTPKSFGLDVA